MSPAILWLLFGAALVLAEVFTAPGIGLFLGGFGAMSTGIVVQMGLVGIESFPAQIAWFFGLSSLWAVLLWRPLQKYRVKQTLKTHAGAERSDIVGSTGTVGKNGIKRHETGQVKWSGTIMNAVLSPHSDEDFLAEGTQVKITAVTGNTLSVISMNQGE